MGGSRFEGAVAKILVQLPQTVGKAIGSRVQGGKGESLVVMHDGDLLRPASYPFLKKLHQGLLPRVFDAATLRCLRQGFHFPGGDQFEFADLPVRRC